MLLPNAPDNYTDDDDDSVVYLRTEFPGGRMDDNDNDSNMPLHIQLSVRFHGEDRTTQAGLVLEAWTNMSITNGYHGMKLVDLWVNRCLDFCVIGLETLMLKIKRISNAR